MDITEIVKDMENTLRNEKNPCHVLSQEDIKVLLGALKSTKKTFSIKESVRNALVVYAALMSTWAWICSMF